MITTWDDRSKNVVVDLVVDDLAKGYDTADDAPFFTLSENRFPRLDGESYEPAFLLTGEKPKPGENERAALARMITSHPQFARATVNLIWGKLMTAAFVEPYNAFDLDRIDRDNPPEAPWTIQPTNPELLEALAADFRESGYSIHHQLLRSLDGRILSTHVQPVKTHVEAFSPASSRRSDRDLATSRVVSNQARNSVGALRDLCTLEPVLDVTSAVRPSLEPESSRLRIP